MADDAAREADHELAGVQRLRQEPGVAAPEDQLDEVAGAVAEAGQECSGHYGSVRGCSVAVGGFYGDELVGG